MRKLTVCALCSHLCYTNCWLHSGSGVRQLQKGRVKLGSQRGVRLARKKSGRVHRQLLSALSLGKPGRLRWKATAGKETQSWEQVWEAWVAVPAEDWDPEMWGGYICKSGKDDDDEEWSVTPIQTQKRKQPGRQHCGEEKEVNSVWVFRVNILFIRNLTPPWKKMILYHDVRSQK